MQPMTTIRNWQLDQLEKAVPILTYLVQSAPQADLSRYRDSGEGWTVLQVLCHLRDYDVLFAERVRLTNTEDFPALPNPNPDTLAAERDYNNQPIDEALQTWVSNRKSLLALYATIPDDHWEREGNHPKRGAISLNDQLWLTVWHDTNHIEQIARILAEKQG